MRDRIVWAILIVLVCVMIYTANPMRAALMPVRAGMVQREWKMVSTYENRTAAAEVLARAHSRMIELMRILKRKYHIDETDDVVSAEPHEHARIMASPNDLYNIVDHLLDNYNPDVFYENDPATANDTSYTLNKGASMYLCLRDKQDPTKLVDADTLFFVLLHESAHIANYRGFGHGADFWEVFKFLLHEAQIAGVYNPIDYAKKPVQYCGIPINWQPLFDPAVRSLWVN